MVLINISYQGVKKCIWLKVINRISWSSTKGASKFIKNI